MQRSIKPYFPVFVMPTLIAFGVAFAAPFLIGLYLSFTDFATVTDAQFVGLENYIRAFTADRNFVSALQFTVSFTLVSVISINGIAFALALALTGNLRGTNTFRTILFMPNLIGGIVLGYIWNLLINGVLGWFGVDITYDASYGFVGLVLLVNWQLIGYMMVIYIAGLQNIPPEYTEAASIDGASRLQILRHITLPSVMPSITICTFLTLTNCFKVFDQNLALTAGAPGRETAMLALDIYDTFYGRNLSWQGVGQAKAVVFFLIVAVIAFVQLRLTSRKEVDA